MEFSQPQNIKQTNEHQTESFSTVDVLHAIGFLLSVTVGVYFISVNLIISFAIGIVVTLAYIQSGFLLFVANRGTARFFVSLFGILLTPVIYRFFGLQYSPLWIVSGSLLLILATALFARLKHGRWGYDVWYSFFLAIGFVLGIIGIFLGGLVVKSFIEWK